MKNTISRLVIASGATSLAAASLLSLGITAASADPAPSVPFSDPGVRGGALLENAQHVPVTSGTIETDPTFPFVVASDGGRTGDSVATLIVATPKAGQAPADYTQDQLNDSESYPVGTTPTNTGVKGNGLTLGEYINLDVNARQTSTDAYAGLYQLRLNTGGPNKSDDPTYYQAVIKVTETGTVKDANGLMAATGTWQLVEPLVSTTTLAVTPASPSVSGTAVTLTSTTSEVTAGAVGAVQFKEGSTSLGSPVPVNPSTGVASTSLTPSVGTHSYTAQFIPTDATKFDGSTSAASAYTVSAPVVTPPPASLPEAPYAVLLPLLAGGVGIGFVATRRRRKVTS